MKIEYLNKILFFLFWLGATIASSQNTFELNLQHQENNSFLKKNNIQLLSQHSDSLAVLAYLPQLLSQLHEKSFLEASIDSLYFQNQIAFAKLHLGPSYKWLILENGNIPETILSATLLKPPFFKNKPIQWSAVLRIKEQLLEYAEQNGYPFAQVRLDSLQWNDSKATAQLHLNLNQKVIFDKINIIGNAKISSAFLSNFLDIKKGMSYDQTKIENISQRLQNLPYVLEKNAPKVTFKEGKANVYLFLNQKNTSRFDVLVGVLPDNRPQLGQRNVVVTGNGIIDLVNAFGQGERLTLELQQIRPQTQELNSHFSYPYLFQLPFGLSVDFDLLKNDSTNLLLEYEIGLQYLLGGNNYLKVFFNNQQNRLLTINENTIITQRRLPNNVDTQQRLFGLEYLYNCLNYLFNPQKGWSILLKASVGEKNINHNNAIVGLTDPNDETFDFGTLYDEIKDNTTQYRLGASLEYFIPIARRSTVLLKSQNAFIINQDGIFENELYRIGGNQIQRGFDEESILASFYSINTIEYRWLFTKNSNLYTFTDLGYIEKEVNDVLEVVQPIGLGFGLNLETSAGIFGLSIATAKDQRQREDFFDLRNPKVHFGYVNIF